MPEVSILVSARDSFSPSIKNMTNNIRGFSKEAEEAAQEIQNLEKKQESLCDQQAKLRVNLDELKSSLSAARKEFKLTGDEASRLNYEKAFKDIEKGTVAIRENTRAQRENDKAQRELMGTQSKGSNRAGFEKNLFSALASAGFTKMAGDMLAQGANQYVSSAFGSDVGSVFGSTLSGAATGAAMGMPLGPAGAAAGGVIGGAIGLASGGMNVAQKQDEAFKNAVQDVYNRLTQENVEMVQSGIGIAAEREIDQNAFSKMLGGDAMAKQFLGWVKDAAAETPMGYDDLTQMSRRLKTFGYDTEEIKDMLFTIGDTGAGTGSDTYGMQMMINGLGRIKQSGKTNLEYMNPMIERGVPVWDYLQKGLATDLGKELSIQEVQKMSSQNEINADDAVGYIMTGMKEDFGGLMEQQAKTFTGLTSTLEDMRSNIEAAAGEGFATMRKPAMEEQVEHYDMMGNKYEEAAGISGQLEAVQQNRRERIFRDRMTALFEGTDESGYAEALKTVRQAEMDLDEAENFDVQDTINQREDALATALANLQKIVDEAEAQAEAEYKGGSMEKSIENTNAELLDSLRGFLKEDDVWKMWGYNMGIEMGKGMMSVQPENTMVPTTATAQMRSAHSDAWNMDYLPLDNNKTPAPASPPRSAHGGVWDMDYPSPKAFGQSFVPYDNFPALLHQGERVLTASEARAADRGSIPPITITGNSFSVREEADIDKIAVALAQQLAKAMVTYAP